MIVYQLIDRYNGRVLAEGSWSHCATARACMTAWQRERLQFARIGDPVQLATFGFNGDCEQ